MSALADELQRDLDAAGAVRVPDVAEGAGAEFADQLVVRRIRHGSEPGLGAWEMDSKRASLLPGGYSEFPSHWGASVELLFGSVDVGA